MGRSNGATCPDGACCCPAKRPCICPSAGSWLGEIGLDPLASGTHTLRRTKASMIYRRTGNLRAVHLLLGIESTVRSLRIDIDDALAIAEQVEI
ncbi:MAG: integrase [Microvirga sp.]|nr:integrase [Microvirga sp.]